jgi:serine/threonine protein kinase
MAMQPKAPELAPGTVIGAWKVVTPLGHGGQGSVWSAKPAKTKHAPPRALKACFADDDQARARFVLEVEILRRCDSPHILKVYDQDLDWKEHVPGAPAFAFYVSEKCQGSMEQRQRELGDFRRRIALFRQACAAVTYIHTMAEPIIPRDLKPANFLIAQELKNVVLADFGIARAGASSTLTEAFEVVGTPYYRAPEVLHGNRGSIQSDVYCMGRVLEWLLTDEVSEDMATRPVPRGRDLDDAACDLVDRIIAKATQVTAANRFASVKELADQLPELWLSAKPRPKTTLVPASTDAAAVLPAALELTRTNDQLGWRQLEQHLRRDLVDGLFRWRAENERAWRSDRDKDVAFRVTDKLLEVALGRLVFALAGVYSANPALADQRRAIDDLVAIPDWNQGGTTAIAAGPQALIYVLQYLHGALCLGYGQVDLALQFAETRAPRDNRADAPPLWQHHGVTGWPKLLGGECSWAWEYLRGLRSRHVILQQFFALQGDLELGLASYSMALSLMELATDAANPVVTTANIELDVPPLFTGMGSDTVATAARRTLGNRAVVEKLAERTGAKVATMKELWPTWKKLVHKFRRGVFDRHGYPDELPLGELP